MVSLITDIDRNGQGILIYLRRITRYTEPPQRFLFAEGIPMSEVDFNDEDDLLGLPEELDDTVEPLPAAADRHRKYDVRRRIEEWQDWRASRDNLGFLDFDADLDDRRLR